MADRGNSIDQNVNQSSKGRTLKRTGIDEKKMAALEKLREARDGQIRPLDAYKTAEAKAIFEIVDDEEYERREGSKLDRDFIVDDDGFGYADKGGEIWEYEETNPKNQDSKNRRVRKTDKNNQDIQTFLKPQTMINSKKKTTLLQDQTALLKDIQKKKTQENAITISAEQSKDIMEDLFGELDQNENLKDIKEISKNFDGQIQNLNIHDDETFAFNLEDRINKKYDYKINTLKPKDIVNKIQNVEMNVEEPLNDISSSKKRGIEMISNEPQKSKIRENPFANSRNSTVQENKQVEEINQSNNDQVIENVESEIQDIKENSAEKNQIQDCNKIEIEEPVIEQCNMNEDKNSYPLHLNEDKSLSFFWFDAHEENNGKDIYLFGKVWQPQVNQYVSCSLRINGMQRNVFAFPKYKIKSDTELTKEELALQQQSMVIELSQLFSSYLKNTKFKSKLVTRKYCLEMPIAHGEHKFLKIVYPASEPCLPPNLKGNTFECLFGTNQSMLELFILKRKIRGPCWLNIKNVQPIGNVNDYRATWCKQECFINDPKLVVCSRIEDINRPSPPLTSITFSMKTTRSIDNTNEIALISFQINDNVNQDGPTGKQSPYSQTYIRKLQDTRWPLDLQQQIQIQLQKTKEKKVNIQQFQNEKQMLEAFIGRIHVSDPDMMVAHGLCQSVYEIILARINYFKIPHWSRIGRFKRNQVPQRKVGQGGFSDNSWIIRNSSNGRLMVDTYQSSVELLKETNYDLTNLVEKQFNQVREEFDEDMVKQCYLSSNYLIKMVYHTDKDATITNQLMMHLNIIPLTKQLTSIAGNLWYRSLQNARAERNEMLLLHEFRSKKFICPDKKNNKDKKIDIIDENDEGQKNKGKKKKAQYGGGLVLEPKAGFYDSIIMMLDFNSLYPSIIQEYNLCFTTVDRKPTKNFDGQEIKIKNKFNSDKLNDDTAFEQEEEDAVVPSGNAAVREAILPSVLKNLVLKRRQVKQQMKVEKNDVKYKQLDIRQTALKLTANSMYGCLGFTSSRFHAQAIAALITRTGRETLRKTQEIAEQKLGFSVIYGDTDSIMINTGTVQVKEAMEMGKKLKIEVNQLYKCLEIEIDGIFKTMLLLKKKKYAALSIQNFGTKDEFVKKEIKGLDMVRRDWCPYSKILGNFVLDLILSGKERENMILEMNDKFQKFGDDMKKKDIKLNDFAITKQLTKKAELYQDAKNQPHVQVALRMKMKGKSDSELINSYIPYVICKTKDDQNKKVTLGEKAFHPDEFELANKKQEDALELDIDWYISQQLLPPIQRLLEHIEGVEISFVAQCLGADAKKFQQSQQHLKKDDDEELQIGGPIMKQDTCKKLTDRAYARLNITCPHCYESFEMPTIFHESKTGEKIRSDICPNAKCNLEIPPQIIRNRVRIYLKQCHQLHYRGMSECDDKLDCKNQTRQILYNKRCNVPVCKNKMKLNPDEKKVNDTIRYLQSLFDFEKYKSEQSNQQGGLQINQEDQVHQPTLQNIKQIVDKFLKKSQFNNVDLKSIFSFYTQNN